MYLHTFNSLANPAETTDTLESMAPILAEFAHSRDGALAAAKAFGYANTKVQQYVIPSSYAKRALFG